MALERPTYRVTTTQLAGEIAEVRWADQLLAEREGPRHGISNNLPLHLTTYWVWAALKRGGHQVGGFQEFMADPQLDIEPLEAAEVPPTEPAPAG